MGKSIHTWKEIFFVGTRCPMETCEELRLLSGGRLWMSKQVLIPYALFTLYIFLCPFNKVEEAHNINGLYDILHHFMGGELPAGEAATGQETVVQQPVTFSHLQYPDEVPKTFVGAWAIALIVDRVKPVLEFIPGFVLNGFGLMVLSRLVLLTFVIYGIHKVETVLMLLYGTGVRTAFAFLLLSQFHFGFYSSRFLPDSFAMIGGTLAFKDFLLSLLFGRTKRCAKDPSAPHVVVDHLAAELAAKRCIGSLAFTAAVFRSEYLITCLTTAIPLIFLDLISPTTMIMSLLMWGTFGISISLGSDSVMWAGSAFSRVIGGYNIIWPELESVLFNAHYLKGEGDTPWHSYFTSVLPNALGPLTLMGMQFVLIICAVRLLFGKYAPQRASDNSATQRFAAQPEWVYEVGAILVGWGGPIGVMSCSGHKEVRLIFSSILGLTSLGALGVEMLRREFDGDANRRQSSCSGSHTPSRLGIGRMVLGILWIVSFVITSVRLAASTFNYPGGVALQGFYSFLSHPSPPIISHAPRDTEMDLFVDFPHLGRFWLTTSEVPIDSLPRDGRQCDDEDVDDSGYRSGECSSKQSLAIPNILTVPTSAAAWRYGQINAQHNQPSPRF
eukprot:GHVN01059678.1.p1 GENE.GHVN01059678.1~~GHVN01059678.1.p1  ORF type:complete len:613 (+),score=43.83 GHVN01059678.1:1230-3068(+)